MNKAALRKLYRQKRMSLSDAEHADLNQRICENFFAEMSPVLADIDYLHTYLPIARLREADTAPILKQLRSQYSNVSVILSRSNFEQGIMSSYLVAKNATLIENELGIPEPQGGQPFDEILIDVVIVPLLCGDKQGHRVGYGKGFYDRFLAQLRPDVIKVGLSLFPLIDRIEDTHKNDIPLDLIITS